MAQQITATDTGVVITARSGGFSLLGATVTLSVLYPDNVTITSLAMVVAGDNLSATRSTTNADFPKAGNYQIQAKAVNGGVTVRSPLVAITVGPSLG